MTSRILPIFLLAFALLCSVSQAETPETVLTLPSGPNNPRNTEGGFVTLKDGNILYIYSRFSGVSGGDDAQGYLAACTSADGGQTWTKNDAAIFPREGKENDMSASLLRLADGRIALFYLVKNSIKDCKMRMRTSSDEAETWSEPIDCMPGEENYFVVNNDRVIQTKSGRLIAPAAMHVRDGKWQGAADIVCFLSDDSGKTWRRGKQTVIGARDDGSRFVTQEPGVIELKDGRILMWIRSNLGRQAICYSSDGGETFSAPQPWNFDSPVSPASIKRIPSTGDLLLVWNDNVKRRTPLNVAISADEGATWTHAKPIETDPNGWFCYTAIHCVDDRVLLSYWLTEQLKHPLLIGTKVVSVPVKWLYEDKAPTQK
ncbi:glycoside hydrolase [Blastopirellula sp. J2-11]|uniref:sialidase family protein n=1 Tax=Blastopirellula sp. J2-11 TaxID=2943192 RepID=UPI0021C8A984|nr:sialidase family protein [Blastopirellula sp. J2-11]UUO07829.1 glycoside hydrolase [Blastopirellula sp. J2-11]